jgi:hypothetical protein
MMSDELKGSSCPTFITHHSAFIISNVGTHIALLRQACAAGAAGHGLPLFAPVSRRVLMK